MEIHAILDQLSSTYGMPTPAALELNDVTFCSAYSPADAPKVLFRRIKICTGITIIGNNPYTDYQIINNAIHLLLATGLYVRAFKEWDCLTPINQTWIELRRTIQEAFQHQLNATATTAGGWGYAPAFHQNAFAVLEEASDDKESLTNTVAMQVVALAYQSQLTASTAASTMHHQEMQLAHLAAAQDATHAALHHIIKGLNTVVFNVSNTGRGIGRFGGHGGGGRNRQGHGRFQSRGWVPAYASVGPVFPNGWTQFGGFPCMAARPVGMPGGFQGNATCGVPPYRPPAAIRMIGGYGPTGGRFHGRYPCAPGIQAPVQQPFSNTIKRYANWNACYSCGFDVANGHTSMSCPPHLCKATHDLNFNWQNARQYIDLGHPCSTRKWHKTQLRAPM